MSNIKMNISKFNNGCEFCTNGLKLYQETAGSKIFINCSKGARALYVDTQSVNTAYVINYCPNCGRDLRNSQELYDILLKNIKNSIGSGELNRLLSWEYCELEYEFLGFLENYFELQNISKEYTIIDFGCYQAIQADYFKEHYRYIGVEPSVPENFRLQQNNAVYYSQTIKDFISQTLPCLKNKGLNLNKVFAICSAVPDFEETILVAETFPYHKIVYPSMKTIENYPDNYIPYNL